MERMRVAKEEGSDARENEVSPLDELGVDFEVEAVRVEAVAKHPSSLSSDEENCISRRLFP